MSTIQTRVLRRYVQAARILPLVVDKTRITRWISGITRKTVVDIQLLGIKEGYKTMVVASFEDGRAILYEVLFEFSGNDEVIEISPKVKAIRFVK